MDFYALESFKFFPWFFLAQETLVGLTSRNLKLQELPTQGHLIYRPITCGNLELKVLRVDGVLVYENSLVAHWSKIDATDWPAQAKQVSQRIVQWSTYCDSQNLGGLKCNHVLKPKALSKITIIIP